MSGMLSQASALEDIDVSTWDTSKVTDMSALFGLCTSLTSLDVSEWDTSNVTNMSDLFAKTTSLSALDVSKWDTSNVTNMNATFYVTSSLTSLDVSKWDTSKVTNMDNMFMMTSSLTTLDVSSWDTSNVISMGYMFRDATSLKTLNLGNWDTSNVVYMGDMFNNCASLITLNISDWDTSNVSNFRDMFLNDYSLQYLKLGENSIFSVGNIPYSSTELPEINITDEYTGKWIKIENENGYKISQPEILFANSNDFMEDYDGSQPGWYTWERIPVEVIPEAPTLDENVPCDTDFKVIIPTQEGIEYTVSDQGKIIKVAVSVEDDRYVIKAGSTTEWEFNVSNSDVCTTDVDYLKVEANGASKKVKTTKLTLSLSKVINDLNIDDIKVALKSKNDTEFTISNLVSLGEGVYELDINGEWDNETNISVFVKKEKYNIIPDVQDTIIFNVVDENGKEPGSNNGGDTNTTNKIPDTGSDNTLLAIMLFISSISTIVLVKRKFS